MGRWEPNAQERLEKAAMELFVERGYAETTVEEIAARAALTERTFFRYFTDKREVLFSGAKAFEKVVVDAIAIAPASAAPLDAVTSGFEASGAIFDPRRAFAKKRYALLGKNAELRERELIKLATVTARVAEALRARGVAGPEAELAAETGVLVFRTAFASWIHDAEKHEFAHHMREARAALTAIVGGNARPAKASRARL